MDLHIIDPATGNIYWTANDCARYLGIAHDTWTSYVSRGQAPKPVGKYDHLRIWSADEVKTWHSNRRYK